MLQGMQRFWGLMAFVIVWSVTDSTPAKAASVASSQQFSVLAPNIQLADKVVERAEALSTRIRAAWLGGHLPATRTPTTIYVEIDPKRSFARTVIDPQSQRHLVWLVGTEQSVTEHLLEHELVHVALGSQFGDSLPAWGNEGVASRYDNDNRRKLRAQQLAKFAETDSWPELRTLFAGPIRQPWQYAAAVSVTDYLIQQGDKARFVQFLADSQTDADRALRDHYGIASVEQLQREWQHSVSHPQPPVEVATLQDSAKRSVR